MEGFYRAPHFRHSIRGDLARQYNGTMATKDEKEKGATPKQEQGKAGEEAKKDAAGKEERVIQLPEHMPVPVAKKDGEEEEELVIPLPEHMPVRGSKGKVRRAQSTVGIKTPGRKRKAAMSEAAERKARREGAEGMPEK